MLGWLSATAARIDAAVADSVVGRYFRLEGSGHPLTRKGARFSLEVRAGCVTFASMAYIISVNALILSSSGGPCECNSPNYCRDDPVYQLCKSEVNRSYVVATSAISCLASALMGILANMPIGLAPGLGANAYFSLTVVGEAGSGMVPYSQALAVIWLEGWIFFALSIFGVRQWLAKVLPNSLKLSTGAGIGLYLAFIGLGPNGLDVIGFNSSNVVGFAGCLPQYKDAVTGQCMSHVLQNPTVWVGIFLGGVLTALLMLYRVRGALVIGILLVSISSWPRGSHVTQFPYTPDGEDAWQFFKKVATWHGLGKLGPHNIDWTGYNSGKAWVALISFLYIDLLDTTGTLYAMAMQARLVDARTGDFEGSATAYMSDALSISCGSLMGCSPATAFIESAAGIAEGGRTGITALVIAFWFFLSLFFAPIFSSLPAWATGSVLVIVGSMMMQAVTEINWSYLGDALPGFLTIIGIPFMFNIAYGLIAGIISYMILNIVPWLLLKATRGKVVPVGWYTDRDPWGAESSVMVISDIKNTKLNRFQKFAVRSSVFPPWLKKLVTGNWYFWRLSDEEIADYLEGRRVTEERVQRKEAQRRADRDARRNTRPPPDDEVRVLFNDPDKLEL